MDEVSKASEELLVWGTTYPEFSTKYYETVCTGVLRKSTKELVRVYPIRLRVLRSAGGAGAFRQYDWISAKISKNHKDFRPESHHIDIESIEILGHVDPGKDGWSERNHYVLASPHCFDSVERLWEAQASDRHTSLGIVQPRRVQRIYACDKPFEDRDEWEKKKQQALAQRDFWIETQDELKDLAYIPVEFRISFECHGRQCRGHDMGVLDWGVLQLWRKQLARRQGNESQAKRDVVEKLKEVTSLDRKDARLFLGNSLRHPDAFMIVGLYYPPRTPQLQLL